MKLLFFFVLLLLCSHLFLAYELPEIIDPSIAVLDYETRQEVFKNFEYLRYIIHKFNELVKDSKSFPIVMKHSCCVIERGKSIEERDNVGFFNSGELCDDDKLNYTPWKIFTEYLENMKYVVKNVRIGCPASDRYICDCIELEIEGESFINQTPPLY